MRIACVNPVSNTCFPVLAAKEVGFCKAEGLDTQVELVFGQPFSFLKAQDSINASFNCVWAGNGV